MLGARCVRARGTRVGRFVHARALGDGRAFKRMRARVRALSVGRGVLTTCARASARTLGVGRWVKCARRRAQGTERLLMGAERWRLSARLSELGDGRIAHGARVRAGARVSASYWRARHMRPRRWNCARACALGEGAGCQAPRAEWIPPRELQRGMDLLVVPWKSLKL